MHEIGVYVGLDVHKATIAVAQTGRTEPTYHGEIADTPTAVKRLLHKLPPRGEVLGVCYEASCCACGPYRQITALGRDCSVVVPALIPRKAGDRIKADRRDALSLLLHRAGELTADGCRAGAGSHARSDLRGKTSRRSSAWPASRGGIPELRYSDVALEEGSPCHRFGHYTGVAFYPR